QSRFAVLPEERQKGLPNDKAVFDGLHSLSSEFIRLARNRCWQPHHFSRLSPPDDQGLSIDRTCRQLHAPPPKNKHTFGLVTFDKQDRSLCSRAGTRDGINLPAQPWRETAEQPFLHERRSQPWIRKPNPRSGTSLSFLSSAAALSHRHHSYLVSHGSPP